LLRYGDFTARSATLTADTLAAFGVGLVFFSVYLFTLRGFYAMQDTRTPFLVNCFENALNVVLAVALYPALGVQGLALSWSVAYVVASVVALVALRRRLGGLDGRRTALACARIGVAAGAATSVAAVTGAAIGDASAARAVVASSVAIALAAIVDVLALRALRVPELGLVGAALRRRPLAATRPVPSGGSTT
jgi:putative peptidoglycan lipid II flippase